MKLITGEENLKQVVGIHSGLIPFFEKHGLGSYFKPESLDKVGRFTRLNTLLLSKNIDAKSFVANLNEIALQDSSDNAEGISGQENLHFVAMLSCGLRNPYKEFTESYLQENRDIYKDLNYLIEGNVNHELSYYPLLDSIENEDELPDIIMASDVNNFFHRPFIEKFIDKGTFEAYEPYKPHPYLEKAGYSDPKKNYTMYTANMLIMAVDNEKLGDRKMPEKWDDLLDPAFENDIIMRGEEDFFCNAVLLPFFKEKGTSAIRKLAKNIKSGKHPAEMVKLAGKNSEDGAAVYIMPYFFSKRIKSDKVTIVWPSDGAIASPVFILVKKSKAKMHSVLLEFLFGKDSSDMIRDRFFPSINPETNNEIFPEQVKWLGWDFLSSQNIGEIKNEIREEFLKVWNKKPAQG